MGVHENDLIAARLDEIAALLETQRANPHRVRAYRRAAGSVRRNESSVTEILHRTGVQGLERLPGIGPSLARTIREIVAHGYSPMLARLRGELDSIRLLATLPEIGPRLAARLHDEIGIETLTDLEAAAADGRLEELVGFGPKRLEAIRDSLARRLARVRSAPEPAAAVSPSEPLRQEPPPDVRELLDVDREYRTKAARGELTRIAPRRFNPQRAAWLPILHTVRGDRQYTALFSNTERAHRLGKTADWVVLYCDDDGTAEHRWTVITSEFGPLQGRRIVRGFESECAAHYAHAA